MNNQFVSSAVMCLPLCLDYGSKYVERAVELYVHREIICNCPHSTQMIAMYLQHHRSCSQFLTAMLHTQSMKLRARGNCNGKEQHLCTMQS